jgi:hypothetical protein
MAFSSPRKWYSGKMNPPFLKVLYGKGAEPMKHVVKTIITVAAIAAISVFAAGCGSSSNSGSSSS